MVAVGVQSAGAKLKLPAIASLAVA